MDFAPAGRMGCATTLRPEGRSWRCLMLVDDDSAEVRSDRRQQYPLGLIEDADWVAETLAIRLPEVGVDVSVRLWKSLVIT